MNLTTNNSINYVNAQHIAHMFGIDVSQVDELFNVLHQHNLSTNS